jgi:hypothetical protein
MILDGLLAFDPIGTSVIPNGTTQDSTNTIDLHMLGIPVLANNQGARDIGIGDDPALKLLVQVTTAYTTGGTSLSVTLEGATDNGSGAPAAFSAWWASPAYAVATLTLGARLMDMDMPRPPAGIAVPRFLKLVYTSVGALVAGKLAAFIVLDRMDQMYQSTGNATMGGYPAGINVAN